MAQHTPRSSYRYVDLPEMRLCCLQYPYWVIYKIGKVNLLFSILCNLHIKLCVSD